MPGKSTLDILARRIYYPEGSGRLGSARGVGRISHSLEPRKEKTTVSLFERATALVCAWRSALSRAFRASVVQGQPVAGGLMGGLVGCAGSLRTRAEDEPNNHRRGDFRKLKSERSSALTTFALLIPAFPEVIRKTPTSWGSERSEAIRRPLEISLASSPPDEVQ